MRQCRAGYDIEHKVSTDDWYLTRSGYNEYDPGGTTIFWSHIGANARLWLVRSGPYRPLIGRAGWQCYRLGPGPDIWISQHLIRMIQCPGPGDLWAVSTYPAQRGAQHRDQLSSSGHMSGWFIIMRTFCIMKNICIQPTKSCYTLTAFTRSLENWKIYSESPIYLRASVCDHNTLEISQKTFSWDKAADTQWDASWHPHHQWLHSRIKISSFPLTAPLCLPVSPSALIEAMDKVASCII